MESAEPSPSDDSSDPTDKVPWLHREEIEDRPTTRALPFAAIPKPVAPAKRAPLASKPLPVTRAAAPRSPNISPRPVVHAHPKVAPVPAPARVEAPPAPAPSAPPPRKRRTRRAAPRFRALMAAIDRDVGLAQLDTSSEPRTFGATMVRPSNSRAKYIVGFVLALAAIAAVVLLNWHK